MAINQLRMDATLAGLLSELLLRSKKEAKVKLDNIAFRLLLLMYKT
tara:strand:+ start:538 stop:675 length:138 start_codon:yes stop_codon:yes gene_type:complete